MLSLGTIPNFCQSGLISFQLFLVDALDEMTVGFLEEKARERRE